MGRKKQNYGSVTVTPSTEILWRIAVYIRLSREDRNEEKDESESVTNQTKILNEYLEKYFEGRE